MTSLGFPNQGHPASQPPFVTTGVQGQEGIIVNNQDSGEKGMESIQVGDERGTLHNHHMDSDTGVSALVNNITPVLPNPPPPPPPPPLQAPLHPNRKRKRLNTSIEDQSLDCVNLRSKFNSSMIDYTAKLRSAAKVGSPFTNSDFITQQWDL